MENYFVDRTNGFETCIYSSRG